MTTSIDFWIPSYGHSLDSGLRGLTEAGGLVARTELAPRSPFGAGDPEFMSSSLTGWTQTNSAQADTIDADTTLKDHLYINTNATASDWYGATRNGPFINQVVSGNFDVYTRFRLGNIQQYHGPCIIAQSTSNADDWMKAVLYISGSPPSVWNAAFFSTDNASTTNNAINDIVTSVASAFRIGNSFYVRLKRATNDFTAYYSIDGVNWVAVGTSVTRSDFSSDANLGLSFTPANTNNAGAAAFDFIRTWPPYLTTDPTSSIVIDSGKAGSTWDMSTFDDFINIYSEYNPQSQIGFGSLKYKYGASDTDPPSLNASWLTESQMQAESDPSGRYFKLSVQYHSANGYEQASFLGAKITAVTNWA